MDHLQVHFVMTKDLLEDKAIRLPIIKEFIEKTAGFPPPTPGTYLLDQPTQKSAG